MNRLWRLAARPVGLIRESDFTWCQEPLPAPVEGQVLIRNIYLSLDPGNRGWLREGKSYMPPVAVGEVMRGITIGRVEQSLHPDFKMGDLVQGILGWQEYALSDGTGLTLLTEDPSLPITAYFGVLGFIGLTAYFGLLFVGKPQAGETLVVSAGAGAVGSLVGQIGKIKGCRVVGIAGSDEKCRWLTEELGFEGAINYKKDSLPSSLEKNCPQGVDIYFDNVGGEILDALLAIINVNARIVVCGTLAQANATEPVPGPYNFRAILTQRAKLQGFIFTDFLEHTMEAMNDLKNWLDQGNLRYRVDVVSGLEQAPKAINKLFDGSNKGKLIIKISDL